MARSRRGRPSAEHIEERRRRRRPLRTRRSATVAVGKSRFTMLREHAFTMMPQGNILEMYQVMVENIFRERARKDERRCALERREIHEAVQDLVSELGQHFHSQSEVQRLTSWAVRELKKEGRLRQAGPGRLRLSRRRPRPVSVDPDGSDAETDEAEQRRQAWQLKKDRHRARTRMVERYRRRQRRASQSSSAELLSATASEQSLPSTASEQSLPGTASQQSLATTASVRSLPTDP